MVNTDSESASHWEYVDFDLEIGEQRESRKYPVSVRSPEGEAQVVVRFPFDAWELKDKLRDVEVALLRSGGSRRRIGTPEEQTVQAFGRALLETLIAGDVGAHYRVSWREARRQNKGVRVKVHVRPPEFSSLPWEFVYDPKHGYLCLSSRTPLVRYPDVPHPIQRLTVTPPLRILGMVASPQGFWSEVPKIPLPKPFEKGYEQLSDRGFGRCTEAKIERNSRKFGGLVVLRTSASFLRGTLLIEDVSRFCEPYRSLLALSDLMLASLLAAYVGEASSSSSAY